MIMKRKLVFFTAFVALVGIFTIQAQDIHNRPCIDVSGKAEMFVEPDEIILNIVINEKDYSKKTTLEKLEKEMKKDPTKTAKQILMQKLREIERENTVNEFEDKEGELMACTVRRIEDGNVYVEIGGNQIEGVLMPKDQVPGEKYELNQKLNVYVKRVKNSGKNAQIVVSRTSGELVKRLFENEVPEIKQGLVTIKSIAREPGQRTKIAIYSEDPMVDAIGACVGNKGARVNAIVAELGGEKIDIIPWSENPLEYISNYRFNKAIHLLTNTNKNIDEIAEEVGFSSKKVFVKMCRKYLGNSPSKYRKSIKR